MFQKNTEKFAKICNIFLKQLLATEKKTATSITTNIQRYWSNFVNKIDKKDRVYYVKTDIKDAFGSILHVSKLKLDIDSQLKRKITFFSRLSMWFEYQKSKSCNHLQ